VATCPPPRSVIGRINSILSTFQAGNAHTMTELAHLTGLPVSTTHRLATELASWQLLDRSEDGDFRVGPTLRGLGAGTWSVPTLRGRTPQVVLDLCEATNRRARLGVLVGARIAYAEKRVGPEPVIAPSDYATLPAHATAAGKALLAFAPPATVARAASRLTAFTSRTVTRPESLRCELRTVRITKVAFARGELVVGDDTVAMPVFGPDGSAVAALELQVAEWQVDLDACRAALLVAARALSRELVTAMGGGRRLHIVAPSVPPSEPFRSAVGS